MRPAKSINSLTSQQQQQQHHHHQQLAKNATTSPTSPICRCRVMYLGSSVPHITKDGLQGIQEPLRELYPDKATLASSSAGIDSWLSVWSNGILIENVDETGREVKRFFKIDALHYCAAVKFVSLPTNNQQMNNFYTTLPNGNLNTLPNFLPLDSPHARQSNNNNPPIFASILRRTTGIKVLECHAFICKREAAANALVRCCFHAYADTMYAKQIGADVNGIAKDINNNHALVKQGSVSRIRAQNDIGNYQTPPMASRRSKSIAGLNESTDPNKIDPWQTEEAYYSVTMTDSDQDQQQDRNSMNRRKSINKCYAQNCDNLESSSDQQQLMNNDILRKQQKYSKSMHHLNENGRQTGMTYNQLMKEQASEYANGFSSNQSTSASCVNIPNGRWHQQQQQVPSPPPPQQQPFYNPYASRVPSYPPQNLMDAASNGGTLKSIRSMAAKSIASTLLRSKKHAKAMSMAQLNHDEITSFHQPHSNVTTMTGPMMMPPVPSMFLSNIQATRSMINGSQTMKPHRSVMPVVGPPMNFEAMTPKEMKKLLKKSAKYGIDPSKYGENGLPLLPLRLPQMPSSYQIVPHHSKSGTMVSQSMFSDIYGNDVTDLASFPGHSPAPRGPPMSGIEHSMEQQSPMKPILVKPNPDFLKSKAGKKWLKQQREFKKLLPPHLDGLPIIFGPPPVDALEPATMQPNSIQPPTFIQPNSGLPMMDSSGYYNPHPFYGQNGRASATSTLLRYSPHSQIMGHENMNGSHHPHEPIEYVHRNPMMYSNGMFVPPPPPPPPPPPHLTPSQRDHFLN